MKPDRCGDCEYYFEWKGRGRCKVWNGWNLSKTTLAHCLNFKERKHENEENAERDGQ